MNGLKKTEEELKQAGDEKGIENLIVDTLEQMEKEGVKFTLKEATPTSGGFLAIVIFEGFNRPVERLHILW